MTIELVVGAMVGGHLSEGKAHTHFPFVIVRALAKHVIANLHAQTSMSRHPVIEAATKIESVGTATLPPRTYTGGGEAHGSKGNELL
jgi:hypothetical protein